ncbi:MAG: HU family DNA-binding protein [Bacteroidaceae bacterium]|nr:HU family DNA-binding protein [Bacteroidaceae bacterium]
MDNKLNIQDLALAFSEANNMDLKSSIAFVKSVFEIVEEYVTTEKLVKIKGFGTFKLISVSDRESVNVNTGERILIAGHGKMTFTPDTALKDIINKPFGDFQTTPVSDAISTEEMERIPTEDTPESADDDEAESISDEVTTSAEETTINPSESPLQEETPSDEDNVSEIEDTPSETIETPSEIDNTTSETNEALSEVEEIPSEIEETGTEVAPVDDKQEEVPVQEEQEEEKVSAAPVILEVTPTPATSSHAENPSYPMAAEPISDEPSCQCKKSPCRWLCFLFTFLLMVASYFAGLYRVHEMIEVNLYPDTDKEEIVVEKNTPVEAKQQAAKPSKPVVSNDSIISKKDTVAVAPAPAKKQESAADIAKYFPQVKGGEYWIVGDAGHVHTMQVGETLYRIAKKELGDRELIQYLIVFNDFENPNIIHTGDTIRIPKLVKKTPEEIAAN